MSAMQEGDELCLEAVDLMLTILGAEAGHMGIRLLASGGVYLTGGAASLCHWSNAATMIAIEILFCLCNVLSLIGLHPSSSYFER